jgi:hypothetical protein
LVIASCNQKEKHYRISSRTGNAQVTTVISLLVKGAMVKLHKPHNFLQGEELPSKEWQIFLMILLTAKEF